MTAMKQEARELESAGRYGDTRLAHINEEELQALIAILGPPTINPDTGLPEFFGWKDALSFLAPAAGAIIGSELGGDWLPEIGITEGAQTIGGALGGAAGGALTSGTKGAILGGLGGGLYPNLGDIWSGITNSVSPGGASPSGASGPVMGRSSFDIASQDIPDIGGARPPAPVTPAGIGMELPTEWDDYGGIAGFEESSVPQGYALGGVGQELAGGAPTSMGTGYEMQQAPDIGGGAGAPSSTPPDKSMIRAGLDALGIEKPGSLLLPGAALAYIASQGNEPIPRARQLEDTANRLSAMGERYSQALEGGPLPAGMQQSLDAANQSAKAAIRSQYARMGLSGSSMEAQALAGVDQRTAIQRSQMAMDLLQTGMKQTGMANDLYAGLMKAEMAQDDDLTDALGEFAAAMGGSIVGGGRGR